MNLDKLQGFIPMNVLEQLSDMMAKFNITNPLRLCHFLAQCEHESGEFKYVKENLNYSAERLLQVFPRYFTA